MKTQMTILIVFIAQAVRGKESFLRYQNHIPLSLREGIERELNGKSKRFGAPLHSPSHI